MKSEPDVFSIDDLQKQNITTWEGVRNYQARNFMMNDMSIGDLALFYHSNASPPGVAGLMKISSAAEPDPAQFDKKSEYYDPTSKKESPRWHCVRCEFLQKFDTLISLESLKAQPELKDMLILKKGNRLSITPLSKKEFDFILKLSK